MKIPVSTKRTQGQRENDFCFATEGERLYPDSVCDSSKGADDHCGCARCLDGLSTFKGTTTALIVESPRDRYVRSVVKSLHESFEGWLTREKEERIANEVADKFERDLVDFRVGDVVEYRDGKFALRERAKS